MLFYVFKMCVCFLSPFNNFYQLQIALHHKGEKNTRRLQLLLVLYIHPNIKFQWQNSHTDFCHAQTNKVNIYLPEKKVKR